MNDPIGIEAARKRHPNLFAKWWQPSVLIVEHPRNGAWSPPSAARQDPVTGVWYGVTGFENPVSAHAREVLNIIVGNTQVKEFSTMQAAAYARDILGARPAEKRWGVENHSYGMFATNVWDVLARMDERIEQHNVVCCVAYPNSNSNDDLKNAMYWRSHNAIVVGSPGTLGFVNTLGGNQTYAPHVRGASKFTSHACAEVSAVAALLVEAVGPALRWDKLRDILVETSVGGIVHAGAALDYVFPPTIELVEQASELAQEQASAPQLSWEDLEQQLADAIEDTETLAFQVEALNAEKKSLAARVSELNEELTQARQTIQQLIEEADSSRTESYRAEDELVETRKQLEELNEQLDSATRDYTALREAVDEFLQVVDEEAATARSMSANIDSGAREIRSVINRQDAL